MSDQTSDGKMDKSSLDKKITRRKAVKTIAGGITALAAYHTLPAKWEKPILESIFIPAHAQTSAVDPTDPTNPENPGPDPQPPIEPSSPIEPIEPPTPPFMCDWNVDILVRRGSSGQFEEAPSGSTIVRSSYTYFITTIASVGPNAGVPIANERFHIWVIDNGVLLGGGATVINSDSNGEFQFTLNLGSLGSGETRQVIVKAVNAPYSCAFEGWNGTLA